MFKIDSRAYFGGYLVAIVLLAVVSFCSLFELRKNSLHCQKSCEYFADFALIFANQSSRKISGKDSLKNQKIKNAG